MWRIYSSIVYEHDLAYVALAAAVCVLSSFTAAGIAQRALGAERLQRLAWLAVGGLVTGAGIWTTHFTAMLGFAREAGLHFDPLAAALSLTLCTLFSTLGWVTGFAQQDRLRGVAAGVLIGAGLGFAHFFDMTALRFAGHLSFDIDLTITSLVGGMSITALAGPLLQRFPHAALAWPTACALVLGTLFLHFVAISGVNLGSTAGAPAAEGLELAEISSGVIAGCLTLIAAALGLAFHGHRVAKLTAADR
jgi:NO-binding membrane sensor protein with MHYT domain